MSDRERDEQEEPQTDEGREPLLTPDHVTDADTEFKQNVLADEAAQGLDQLEGPDIKAVMRPDPRADREETSVSAEVGGDKVEEGADEALDDLFDPPGYYDADGDSPVGPADEDVGIRSEQVSGPRRQVGEAAHNPPIGEAPKKGASEEALQEEEEA